MTQPKIDEIDDLDDVEKAQLILQGKCDKCLWDDEEHSLRSQIYRSGTGFERALVKECPTADHLQINLHILPPLLVSMRGRACTISASILNTLRDYEEDQLPVRAATFDIFHHTTQQDLVDCLTDLSLTAGGPPSAELMHKFNISFYSLVAAHPIFFAECIHI